MVMCAGEGIRLRPLTYELPKPMMPVVNKPVLQYTLENLKKHDFQMYFGSWVATPVPNDPKQIYHSESAREGGSNYVSFGTPQSDALIDSIRVELDEEKRAELYKKLQAILYDEVSYIYLFAPTERIAIHNRFSNSETSVMRPGFWEAGFQLAGQE